MLEGEEDGQTMAVFFRLLSAVVLDVWSSQKVYDSRVWRRGWMVMVNVLCTYKLYKCTLIVKNLRNYILKPGKVNFIVTYCLPGPTFHTVCGNVVGVRVFFKRVHLLSVN